MGCCGGGPARPSFRAPADGSASAQGAAAGSFIEYEVIDGRGQPTGRRFSSLIAATQYAQRLGGSTKPV